MIILKIILHLIGIPCYFFLLTLIFSLAVGIENGASGYPGDVAIFAFQNPWSIIAALFIALIYTLYLIKHEENKVRRKKEKKYQGSLIGKPLDLN